MEKYFWSLDISTTNIGTALWDDNGKLIELKHLELKTDKNVPIEDRDIHKAEIFRKYVLDYKERILNELNGEIVEIIVEEPLGGSNNSNTVSLLFGFNGICRYILYRVFEVYPVKISVHESRKLFLPELINTTKRKNRKTGEIEIVETLSFPVEFRDEKKLYIWRKVCELEPQIEWFYNKKNQPSNINFDMSDAYACGYSGMIKLKLLEKYSK